MRLEGEARVIFLGYSPVESPAVHPPSIVLVRPNEIAAAAVLSGKFWENLGLLTLATHLQANGVRLGVLAATLFQCAPSQTVELAIQPSPTWIGIAAYCTWILDDCLHLAALIKRRRPDIRIVVGGHGVNAVGREILESDPAVDAVIRGEGEESLLQLVRAASLAEWASIPNLSYRGAGGIVENPAAPSGRNLDDSPLPSRIVRDLMEDHPVLSRAPLMMFTSKGCYDHCSYCTVNRFFGGWKGRSPRRVVDELEALTNRYGWRTVHFWDDQFAGPGPAGKRRTIELAEELTRRQLDVVFHVTIRPSDVTEEAVEALAAAGLRSVFLGVESAEQALLDGYFGKHMKTDDSREAIDRLWRHGVRRIVTGFMLFHPKMTWDSFRRDLDLLDGFPTLEHTNLISRTVFYPGSQLWSEVRARLGSDAYKDVHLPALPAPAFERLYQACCHFLRQTVDIEIPFVCLEERYLHDLEVITFLASCRARLFRFMSARARRIAGLLERGEECGDEKNGLGDEAFHETMRIVSEMHQRLTSPYFDHLLMVNRLLGYRQFLDDGPGASH